MTRIANDVETLNELFSSGLVTVFGDVFTLSFIVVAMLNMNWRLALVSFSVLPFVFVIAFVFRAKIRTAYRDIRRQVARLNAFIHERFTGIQIVQLFNKEKQQANLHSELNQSYLDAHLRSITYYALFFPIIQFFTALALTLIIWYGGLRTLDGAITVGVLTAPQEMNGYDWDVLPAVIVAVLLSAAFGWALAYPTARLRMDYFAIVTISLGEIVRVLLAGEPLLRSGPIASAIGIGNFTLPLKKWWFCGSDIEIGEGSVYLSADDCRGDILVSSPATSVSDLLNLGDPAPYFLLLAVLGMICVFIVWRLLESLLASPWGRILKAIREDEDVAQHHGHDVLTHKAASLALGAAIAALAGAFWAWKLTGFEPTFMAPAKSTFLVWAAFVIGGAANNRGMIIGASIIVLMEFVFNVLVAASSPDLPLYTTANRVDSLFEWLVTDQWAATKAFLILTAIGIAIRSREIAETGICGSAIFAFTALMLQDKSIDAVTNLSGDVSIAGANMAYVKVMLVGCMMLFSLRYSPKGLLPEVPSRPVRPADSGGEPE